jgi:hypothetical protein
MKEYKSQMIKSRIAPDHERRIGNMAQFGMFNDH